MEDQMKAILGIDDYQTLEEIKSNCSDDDNVSLVFEFYEKVIKHIIKTQEGTMTVNKEHQVINGRLHEEKDELKKNIILLENKLKEIQHIVLS
mgnify:CR=1 FL=1|tara:strand:+ start:125 stop:403 length:279 start_codon:yes stop_codon:yes gene_type:complete